MLELLSALASVATAIAVVVAAWQLRLTQHQGVTNFEDSLAKEYRKLASRLPTKALLGEPLTEEEHSAYFDELYHYIDLCNEQVFLHNIGRISETTWVFWKDGIAANLRRPAFARGWAEIAARANSDFSELRSLFPPTSYTRVTDVAGTPGIPAGSPDRAVTVIAK